LSGPPHAELVSSLGLLALRGSKENVLTYTFYLGKQAKNVSKMTNKSIKIKLSIF
jgi:hypothetical protein